MFTAENNKRSLIKSLLEELFTECNIVPSEQLLTNPEFQVSYTEDKLVISETDKNYFNILKDFINNYESLQERYTIKQNEPVCRCPKNHDQIVFTNPAAIKDFIKTLKHYVNDNNLAALGKKMDDYTQSKINASENPFSIFNNGKQSTLDDKEITRVPTPEFF